MTVGIYLTNGKEAVVITDSRLTSGGRQSDSIDKLLTFNRAGICHGVLFGTGSANVVLGTFRDVETATGDSLKRLIKAITTAFQQRRYTYEAQVIEDYRRMVERSAVIYPEGPERTQFVQNEHKKIAEWVSNREKNYYLSTSFVIAVYDSKQNRIRAFTLDSISSDEIFTDYLVVGSGADGSHYYFTIKLQGISTKHLKCEDLLFFSINALSFATANTGVGGTPHISVIKSDEVQNITTEKVNALGNVSGAFLSNTGTRLDLLTARNLMASIYNDRGLNYKRIAGLLEINESTLRNLYIPYSTWQECSNRRHFPAKQE